MKLILLRLLDIIWLISFITFIICIGFILHQHFGYLGAIAWGCYIIFHYFIRHAFEYYNGN